MAFDRSLKPQGKSSGQGNVNQFPQEFVPTTCKEIEYVREQHHKANGDYGKVLSAISQKKNRKRGREQNRKWMFDDELLKGPCCGNEARCEDMKEAMRKDPKLYRIHPDCTAAKGFTEQFKGLCLDAENEASDFESEQKLETSGNVSGDTEKQRKIIQAFGASGGASGPRKRKATSAEGEEPIQNEDEEEAARQAAEEAQKQRGEQAQKG